MNKKAFELAISTLIVIVLGIFVLIALVLAVTGGFDRFRSSTDPYLDTTQAIAIQQACELACESNNPLAYCCSEHEINDEMLKCSDNKLQVSCNKINCAAIQCESTI